MEIANKLFVVKTLNKFFVFRIPGRDRAFIMLWFINSNYKKIALKIWKFTFKLEVG